MSERNLSAALDINHIIQTSRRNNKRVGVTGFLMFDGVYFAQVLEGSRSAVTHTYNRVAGDLRHYNMHLISCIDVQERLFPGWSMGLMDGVPPEKREKFLAYFTLERIDPNRITLDRLLYFLQALAVEVRDAEYNRAAQ
jgi:hypothetical protein